MDNSDFGQIDFSFPFDDYTQLHAQGSTSDCYKVRINGKWHFLKRPKKELNRNPFYLSAFEKEFDLGFNLEHPNIVRYINKGKDKDGSYFITEFIDGFTLDEFIKQNPDYFKQKQHVEKFINQLLSAISYLHGKQILHLDLKPQNILITRIDYNVKLIDLGFSYSDCYQTLTIGKTDLYASPEQLQNEEIDQRADIYGIGMVLLYVFTQTSDISSLSQVPSKYRAIIKKCLSKEVEQRYFNVSSLNRAINQPSKTKYIWYGLSLILLIGIALFFIFNPYSIEKQDEAQNEIKVIPDTLISTEEIQDEPITEKVIAQQDIKPQKDESINIFKLKTRIEKEIKGLFDEMYSKYSSTDLMNEFEEVQQTYQHAVTSSFEIANTLYSENPKIPIDEVNYLIRQELDKNTVTYLNWLMKYDQIQKATLNKASVNTIIKDLQYPIDEINSLPDNSTLAELNWLMAYKEKQREKVVDLIDKDSLMMAVQFIVQRGYDKLFSLELSPIDILDFEKKHALELMYQTTRYNSALLSSSLSSTYPLLPITELSPAKDWITVTVSENKARYDNWIKEYCRNNRDSIISYAKENGIYINNSAKRLLEE